MKRLIIAVMISAGMCLSLPAMAAPSPILMERLLTHPDTGSRPYMGERFRNLTALQAFYADRDYQPVWNRQSLEQLSYAFMAAKQAGLNPSSYHLDALSTEYSNDNEMAIELFATDAWLSLAADMLGESRDMTPYFEYQLMRGRLYEGLAELAAFRAGR